MKDNKNNRVFYSKQPSRGLKAVLKYAEKGDALDIGAGTGADSLFLAQNGFRVEAIDKNTEDLKELDFFAKKYKLPIQIKTSDIRKIRLPKEKYSLVVAITSLDFLRLSEIKSIFAKIKISLKKEGIFYFAAFSTKDPSFKISKKADFKMIEKNTFYFPKIKSERHYFQEKELRSLLKDFEIIKFEEIYKKHIPKTKHFHNFFRVIAKK
ncbi:methyltransferase domain-containing protein [Candidatus Shapirobacteria bacterium]|nr:methyltransferase domain-containing protein [Candidatus Shapirobacteria bacterium]